MHHITRLFSIIILFQLISCDKKVVKKSSFEIDYAQHIEKELMVKGVAWENFKTYRLEAEKQAYLMSLSDDFRSYILAQIKLLSYQESLNEKEGLHLKIAYNNSLDPALGERLASYYLSIGSIQFAMETLESIFARNKSIKVGMVLAGIYAVEKRDEQVNYLYKNLEKKYGLNFELCQGIIRFYQKTQKMQNAINYTRKCEKATSDRIEKARYRYSLGRVFLGMGRFSVAKNYFQQSFYFDPKYEGAVLALGVIHEEEGKWKKSLDIYSKFIESTPGSEVILNQMIELALKVKEYDRAINSLEKLVDISGSNIRVKYRLAKLYLKSEKFYDAEIVFKELSESEELQSESRYYLGHIYSRKKEFKRAIASFNGVSKQSAYFSDTSFQLVKNHVHQVEKKKIVSNEEIKQIEKLINSRSVNEKNKIRINTLFAHFLHNKKETKKAIEVVEAMKKSVHFEADHQYFLAALLEEKKDYEQSDTLLYDLIKKNPKNAHALNFLGYSLVSRGESLDQAYKFIKRAVKLKPKDGYILDSLGWYYFSRGKYRQAQRTLAKALKLQGGDDPTILSHYARSLDALDRTFEAYKSLRKAMRLANDDKTINEVKLYFNSISKRLPASVR